MAKKLKKGIDIHNPNMVKLIFILVSIAIVCFLVVIVKYTSFKSESKAAPPKTLPKNIGQKPQKLSSPIIDNLIKRACIRKFNENNYYTIPELYLFGKPNPSVTYQDSGNCKGSVTYYKGIISIGQFYTGWKRYWYNLWYNKLVSCCINVSEFKERSDKYCSNILLYDKNAKPIGTQDMKCKLNCSDFENSEYNLPTYYYIHDVNNLLDVQTIKVSCKYAELEKGEYKVVSGVCCGKSSY